MCKESHLEVVASELVEVLVDDATKIEWTFPQDLKTVESGRIVAIAGYSVAQMARSPKNKPVVNATIFSKAYLVLRNRKTGRDDINKFPLIDLVRSANNGEYVRLDGSQYDFSQSKIVVPENGGAVAGEVFLLQLIYVPLDQCR